MKLVANIAGICKGIFKFVAKLLMALLQFHYTLNCSFCFYVKNEACNE